MSARLLVSRLPLVAKTADGEVLLPKWTYFPLTIKHLNLRRQYYYT